MSKQWTSKCRNILTFLLNITHFCIVKSSGIADSSRSPRPPRPPYEGTRRSKSGGFPWLLKAGLLRDVMIQSTFIACYSNSIEKVFDLIEKNMFCPRCHHSKKNGRGAFRQFTTKSWLRGDPSAVQATSANDDWKKQDETHEPECRHVCWETEVEYLFVTISSEHSCGTPWLDTLSWHSCRTPLLDTIALRSGKTLLHDTLNWHSSRHSYLTLL